LKPDNISLDWDWNVPFADFDPSNASDKSKIPSLTHSDPIFNRPSINFRYLAPECDDNCEDPESDVFSFGMILYELLVGRHVFSKKLTRLQITVKVAIDDERLPIPQFVFPSTRKLIMDCRAKKPEERPSVEEFMDRQSEMKFKVILGVNPTKIRAFVKETEKCEARNADIQQ
jgi:serine/threonine protein kinase